MPDTEATVGAHVGSEDPETQVRADFFSYRGYMTSPDPDAVRIGTAEREESASVLGQHLAEGRLEMDEYESRVKAAFEATTRSDLRSLFTDLPAPRPVFLAPAMPQIPYPMPQTPYPMAAPYHVPQQHHAPAPPIQYSAKSKAVAGVLQLALPFGTGRFYTGHTQMAVAQLLVAIFTFGLGCAWSWIDGIILLASDSYDANGYKLTD